MFYCCFAECEVHKSSAGMEPLPSTLGGGSRATKLMMRNLINDCRSQKKIFSGTGVSILVTEHLDVVTVLVAELVPEIFSSRVRCWRDFWLLFGSWSSF